MKTFLGLPVLQQKFPHHSGMFVNFGLIALFGIMTTILILWLGFDMFQNADKPATLFVYSICASAGVIVQHIARLLINGKKMNFTYSHWTNMVFLWGLLILGYFLAADLL